MNLKVILGSASKVLLEQLQSELSITTTEITYCYVSLAINVVNVVLRNSGFYLELVDHGPVGPDAIVW